MDYSLITLTSLAVCESTFAYSALNLLWGVGYNFLVPYLLGALATLDDRGRWAVAGESLWNGGAVPGPWIAAVLVQEAGMSSLAVWSLVTGGICLVLVTGALRRFESRHTGATSPQDHGPDSPNLPSG
jgi:predicted MFS family arabinose efflux permease